MYVNPDKPLFWRLLSLPLPQEPPLKPWSHLKPCFSNFTALDTTSCWLEQIIMISSFLPPNIEARRRWFHDCKKKQYGIRISCDDSTCAIQGSSQKLSLLIKLLSYLPIFNLHFNEKTSIEKPFGGNFKVLSKNHLKLRLFVLFLDFFPFFFFTLL